MPRGGPRLRVRLFVMVVLLAAPAFGLLVYDALETRDEAYAQAQERARTVAAGAVSAEAGVIERVEASLRAVAATASINGTDPSVCTQTLADWLVAFPDFSDAGLLDPSGQTFCTVHGGILQQGLHNESAFFTNPLRLQRFHPGEFRSLPEGEGRLVFGYPVVEGGETVAVVAATMRIGVLNEAMAALGIEQGTTIMLIDGTGRVLARVPDPDGWVGTRRIGTPVVDQAITTTGSFSTTLDGEQAVAVSRPTRYGADPHVVAVTKTGAATAAATAEAAQRLVAVGALAFVMGTALAVSWSRLVARPLQSLEAGAAALGQGRMIPRVSHGPLPRELQRVADSFDRMADEVQRTRLHLERKVLERTVELRERNTQLQSATRYKSEFLANMSHEIRTPLNAVIGMANVLADMDLRAEQRDAVETIRLSGHHLLAIISDILDISRIEAGHVDVEKVPMSVRAMVEESLTLVAPGARRKGLHLLLSVAPDVPEGINADAGRLRQIIVNLAGNSVKFTDEGHVLVRVERAGDLLVFSVEDTGPGIPAHLAPELFMAFHQLDSTSARRHGGTGLGLAISQRLAELMGGTLVYMPRPGHGAIFRLQLPVEEATPPTREPWQLDQVLVGRRVLLIDDHPESRAIHAQLLRSWGMEVHASSEAAAADVDVVVTDLRGPHAAVDADAPPTIHIASSESAVPDRRPGDQVLLRPVRAADLFAALSGRLGGTVQAAATRQFDPELGHRQPLRILLVEDSPVNQRVALTMLERFGYKADVAGGGSEAVAMAQAHDYDIILMDVEMPEMDGRAAARLILEHADAFIVALTAHVGPEDRRLSQEAGMAGYLSKPVAVNALRDILQEAWDRLQAKAPAAT